MNILNYIKDKQIIICENDCKEYLLKKFMDNKSFFNVKFYTKKDFLKEYLFSYDDKVLGYLVSKYHYKVDVAKMYLDNIYYIEDREYDNEKLKFLVKLKQELEENKLIIYNDNFKNFISSYSFIVVGYPYLSKLETKIFSDLNALVYEVDKQDELPKVYNFSNIEEEINFVAYKISELIESGVSLNKIKITCIDEEYYKPMLRIFDFYQIPIKLTKGSLLYSSKEAKSFLANYSLGIEESLNLINGGNQEYLNKIINICNKYMDSYDDVTTKALITNEFKNTYIDNYDLKDYIEVIDLFSLVTDEYVFLMNFNMGIVPKCFKDEEYITDNIVGEVNLDSTIEKNRIYREKTKDRIKEIKNLNITYKDKSPSSEYYPSSLIEEMNLEVIKEKANITKSYSRLNDLINYAIKEDNYCKYGYSDQDHLIYKNSIKDFPYNTYNHQFKGVLKDELIESFNNKLRLSYTSLNDFNKCAFKYYLTNILKVNKYEETFNTIIGTLFHKVLEKCYEKDLDVVKEVDLFIETSEYKFSNKELFFLDILKDELIFIVDVLNKQKELINLNDIYYEKVIEVKKEANVPVEFVGVVDKIFYKKEEDKELVAIVDYKTGNTSSDIKYLPYGLGMQLPIYLYLVKHSKLFSNPKYVGFYLQNILNQNITKELNTNYTQEKISKLKLNGYSNSDIHSLVEFDKTFACSELIKSLKVKKDGNFSSSAKVLDDVKIEKIISLVEDNIDKATREIIEGSFNINPKKIGYQKDVGCEYCKFKDICYKTDSDYVILDEINNYDFLNE